jgi:hypothetical protein
LALELKESFIIKVSLIMIGLFETCLRTVFNLCPVT